MPAYTQTPIASALVVLVGPTSSGKSELAVHLAKKFNGEILNADSRQIYRGLDLGTGKIPGHWSKTLLPHYSSTVAFYIYKSIPHHLIDFVSPKKQYSAALFQRDAKKVIADILKRGKLPILCGGTAHWIDSVVYNQQLPDVKANLKLRWKLEKKSADKLYRQLKKLDPVRAKNIDQHNKRRLIRALEIINATGKPVPRNPKTLSPYNPLWLGINIDRKTLYKKIDKRLHRRLKQGLVKEVANLHRAGLSWKKLMSFGLEYKFVSLYLQKKLSADEMFAQLSFAIKHYSKRQMTWWKRNKQIKWISDSSKIVRVVEKFLK